MTKDEWIARCAARYVERAGLDQSTALAAAEANFAEQDGEFDTLRGDYDPEYCADEDMSNWTDDGD